MNEIFPQQLMAIKKYLSVLVVKLSRPNVFIEVQTNSSGFPIRAFGNDCFGITFSQHIFGSRLRDLRVLHGQTFLTLTYRRVNFFCRDG